MSTRVALARRLKVDVKDIEFLDSLGEAETERLIADLRAAEEGFREQVSAGLDEALEHVPRLLRGRVRKLFAS